jgi:Flp pilus assembly protein TadD
MVAGGFMVVRDVLNVPSAGFSLKGVTWKDYLFTQFRMYWMYLRLLAIPFGLNADYDIQLSRTLWQHFSWLGLAGIVALVGAAIRFRNRWPLVSFGVLFFFLTLFVTSSFYPLLDYAAERRLYLPSIGFLVAALGLVVNRWGETRGVVVGLALVTAVYGAGTYQRNQVWADPLELWRDTAEKSPGKWRAFNNLGREYSDDKQFAAAAKAYQTAVELASVNRANPEDRAELMSNLGSTYANRGLYTQAVAIYQEALKVRESARLWTNLGVAEVRMGRPEGWEKLQKAIEMDPMAWEPHMARGGLYYLLKQYDEAIREYERVLRLLPDHPDALYNLKAARAMKMRR